MIELSTVESQNMSKNWTEKQLEAFYTKEVKALPYEVVDIKIMRANVRGVPDRLAVGTFPGGFCFIEFKSPKGTGRLSLHQISFHKLLRAVGAEVYVVASKDDVLALPMFNTFIKDC